MKKIKIFAAILTVAFVVGSSFTAKKMNTLQFGLLSRTTIGSYYQYSVEPIASMTEGVQYLCDNVDNVACEVSIATADGVNVIQDSPNALYRVLISQDASKVTKYKSAKKYAPEE